jgi:hypothetical protein
MGTASQDILGDLRARNGRAYALRIYLEALTIHDGGFSGIVRDWYRRIYWANHKAPRFVCSRCFICSFIKRNRFSLRRQHFKRRPPTTNAAMNDWIQSLSSLLESYAKDLVLNCDETAWRLYPNNILTWWATGDDDFSIHVNGDEKGCITVLATVSASRVKGQTQRVGQSQIGDVSGNWRTHSDSGWMKGELFCEYLRHIRPRFPTGRRIYPICVSSNPTCEGSGSAAQYRVIVYPTWGNRSAAAARQDHFRRLEERISSSVSNPYLA